jgi:hypothetical protein
VLAVLKYTPCPACGHRHHFCLPDGEAPDDRVYAYVCPETGRQATLRPEVTAEVAQYPPMGAVQLTPAGRPGH